MTAWHRRRAFEFAWLIVATLARFDRRNMN
jgi:hypothetical protein